MGRISTGFHRIGIVLAAPLLMAALGFAGYEWNAERQSKDLEQRRLVALENAARERDKQIKAATKRFELQASDGKTYEIEAPDENAAITAMKKMIPGPVLKPVDVDPWADFRLAEGSSARPWEDDPIVKPAEPGPWMQYQSRPYEPNYWLSVFLGALAVAVYLASRSLGWVISGFAGAKDY